jgi:hypothetical protein
LSRRDARCGGIYDVVFRSEGQAAVPAPPRLRGGKRGVGGTCPPNPHAFCFF